MCGVRSRGSRTRCERAMRAPTVHTLRINQGPGDRVFDCPLSSFKHTGKDDVAGALALPMEDTIVELVKVIKDHLAENFGRANELRFSGLFGGSKEMNWSGQFLRVINSAASTFQRCRHSSPPHMMYLFQICQTTTASVNVERLHLSYSHSLHVS